MVGMVRGMVCPLLDTTARELGLLKRMGAFWSLVEVTCSFQEMYTYALGCKPSLAAGGFADND